MIAPHYERLAKENARPKKLAFAKVNVDTQASIARTYGVSAMPTFKIFRGDSCVETLRGANPADLSAAVARASKLADAAKPAGGASFKTPGRTLGGSSAGAGGAAGVAGPGFFSGFSLKGLVNVLIAFVGLYLVSLFAVGHPPPQDRLLLCLGDCVADWAQIDATKAAENSPFNANKPADQAATGPAPGSGANAASRAAKKPAFRTFADLNSES